MLRWEKITKVFKSDLLAPAFTALDDVSFEIPEGSMVGFLGANGAGKTTCLKIALDFIHPTSGRIEYGHGVSKKEFLGLIGFLPERPYYYPHLRGFEFVRFMGELSGIPRREIESRMLEEAKRFRLEHALNRELKTYSKGMLQRIGFLVAILHRPKMIILDEPLSGLDPVGRKEMKDIIVSIHKEGCTVFFSSHIVSDVEEICDRVVFLRQGKLIHDGKVAALLESHSSTVWRATTVLPVKDFEQLLISNSVLNSGLSLVEVSPEHKDKFIEHLVRTGNSLVGLEQVRPRLEEIFYQTGQKS